MDDVVDLSMATTPAAGISQATVRDLQALTQSAGLTITRAAVPATNAQAEPQPPPAVAAAPAAVHTDNGAVNSQEIGERFNVYGGIPPINPLSLLADITDNGRPTRRVLRPRTEPRSYVESPDLVLLPARVNGRAAHNGNIDSETSSSEDSSDDGEMPPMHPIKELSPTELLERERTLRTLREELRNEETKLILLKKLKQSQQIMMKENLIVTPSMGTGAGQAGNAAQTLLTHNSGLSMTNLANNNSLNNLSNNPLAGLPLNLPKGSLSVTPTNAPMPAHKNRSSANTSR